jgi:hypothetical protein
MYSWKYAFESFEGLTRRHPDVTLHTVVWELMVAACVVVAPVVVMVVVVAANIKMAVCCDAYLIVKQKRLLFSTTRYSESICANGGQKSGRTVIA